MADVIEDRWGRFFGHWAASTVGYFLREFLPVLRASIHSNQQNSVLQNAHLNIFHSASFGYDPSYWWQVLILASAVSLLGGGINSNMPCKPRELVKSLGLGFALDIAKLFPS
jgi:hypothetical protein